MKARIIPPRKTAALFFIDSEKGEKLKGILALAEIETIVPPEESFGGKLGSLMELPGFPKENIPSYEEFPHGELIVFSGLDRSNLDKALSLLKKNGIAVRFKAVITEYNKNFTLKELMEHMFAEEEKFI